MSVIIASPYHQMPAMSPCSCDNLKRHTYMFKNPQRAHHSHQLEPPGQCLPSLPVRSVSLGLSCSKKKAGDWNKICKKDGWMSEAF